MTELKYPCPENPDSFAAHGAGKFCASCARTITDFRGMSNDELKQAMASSNGHCGIFDAKHVSNQHKNEVSSLFRIAFALIFVFGMSLTDVVAQESKTDTDNWVKIDKLELGNVQVSGHVYDNHGAPMSKAKILIHTTDEIYTLKSDETGQFFLAEAKCFTDKKVTVVVEAKKMISKTILLEDFNSHSFKLIVCMVPKEPRRQPKEKYHVLGIYG